MHTLISNMLGCYFKSISGHDLQNVIQLGPSIFGSAHHSGFKISQDVIKVETFSFNSKGLLLVTL